MSKPRYRWWGYAKAVIRSYPQLMEEYAPSFPDDVTGLDARTLTRTSQREYMAVRQAVSETLDMPNGADRLRLVNMVFWTRTCTLEGAAMQIPCSYPTAQRWHGEFIQRVALKLGLMDES